VPQPTAPPLTSDSIQGGRILEQGLGISEERLLELPDP
jgi:hypothetical protein